MRGRARRSEPARRPHLPWRVQEDQLNPQRITFRADAGLDIGTGHVMRCLTLARALAARGHDCRFVCRDLAGNLNAAVVAEFPLAVLPAPLAPYTPGPEEPAHAPWAGVGWAQDAAETRAALDRPDWLVLDHYAFDVRWQGAARPAGTRLLVIDDLADRAHLANLLLDTNLGRRSRDYDALLPPGAERLIGPRHALLRPEFAAARPGALARRRGPLRHLLVTMGGVDRDNATGQVLRALATLPMAGIRVTVVMGASAPHRAAVEAMALPYPCRVLAGVSDMAALMAEADLAIGAAGGTAWERCALGLPCLLLVLADNQRDGAAALERAGAAIPLGPPGAPDLAERLAAALARLAAPERLAEMAARTAALCDGKGTARVCAALETPLTLRPARTEDAETVWHWRDALPPGHFRAGPNPPLPDHLDWFARALTNPCRVLLMADGPGPLAHLRLDCDGTEAWVSILLAPGARGRGFGLRLLRLLADHARRIGLTGLRAEVADGNAASAALFTAAGYGRAGGGDGFARFTLPL